MTTPSHGAAVNELRDTAQQMCQAAEHLVAISIRLTAALSTLTWNGQDAMRARQAWDTEHGPALAAMARALVEAGQHLLTEADDQERASAPDAAGAAAPSSAAPSSSETGRWTQAGVAALTQTFTVLGTLLNPAIATTALAREAIAQVPEPVRTAIDGANALLNVKTIATANGWSSVPVPTAVSAPVAAAGAAIDLDRFKAAIRTSDVDGALRSGGSLLGSAVGLGNPAAGAVIGGTWEGVYSFRDNVFAGSRWEEKYVSLNDPVADAIGPLAIPLSLITLPVAGLEAGREALVEMINPDVPEAPEGGR